jgi:hypothetical protein
MRYYIPPSVSLFQSFNLLPLLVFHCPSVHIIMFLCLAALHVGILPWSSTRLGFLPPPIVLFCVFLFIIIICTNFYLFNLWFGLLMSFLFQSVPVLYSITVFLCLPTMHVVFFHGVVLGYSSPPLFHFGVIYLSRINCTFSCVLLPRLLNFLFSWSISPQSSVRNYHYSLHKNSEEHRSLLLHSESLKSRNLLYKIT